MSAVYIEQGHEMLAGLPGTTRRLGAALLDSLLPASCALCGARASAVVCGPCHAQYFGQHGANASVRCVQCANPLPAGALGRCGQCLRHRPAFDATLAAGDYAAPLDYLLLQLKFGARLALAPLFARLLRDALLQHGGFVLPALLCPVPLGPNRLAERGFNQALEIARPLSRLLGLPLYPALVLRVRETAPQSLIGASERHANLRRAFAVAPQMETLLRGRHIGIVDDVMSSGQTLHELAATLKRAGAATVSNLVLARTPPH
jgi:ComF family protein